MSLAKGSTGASRLGIYFGHFRKLRCSHCVIYEDNDKMHRSNDLWSGEFRSHLHPIEGFWSVLVLPAAGRLYRQPAVKPATGSGWRTQKWFAAPDDLTMDPNWLMGRSGYPMHRYYIPFICRFRKSSPACGHVRSCQNLNRVIPSCLLHVLSRAMLFDVR